MNEAKKITDKYRLEQWAVIIQERIKSGKPVNEWCKEHGVSRDSYYYYLRKIKIAITKEKDGVNTPQTPKIVPLLPLTPAHETNDSKAAIILRIDGITLEIKDCASDAIIERTLKALKRIC